MGFFSLGLASDRFPGHLQVPPIPTRRGMAWTPLSHYLVWFLRMYAAKLALCSQLMVASDAEQLGRDQPFPEPVTLLGLVLQQLMKG